MSTDKANHQKSGNVINGLIFIRKILCDLEEELAKQGNSNTRFIYRGVSELHDDSECIRSGAAVRLSSFNTDFTYSDYISYVKGLILEVRQKYPQRYQDLKDLEVLADLQHNGAATCLVDFSKNLFVSLWFACGRGQNKEDGDGMLYCYNYQKDIIENNNLKAINSHDRDKTIEELLLQTKPATNYFEGLEYTFSMWEPTNINNRIARQDSIFIFGLPKFKNSEHGVYARKIESYQKESIREALKVIFDIKDSTIFNDEQGFATVNNKFSKLDSPDTKYEQGTEELFKGNYQIALEYFITYEAERSKVDNKTVDFIEEAELHLSKAICYKNLTKDCLYISNAVAEYMSARDAYLCALEKNQNQGDSQAKEVFFDKYSKKLLRTCSNMIVLLYKAKQYQWAIEICSDTKEKIRKLNQIWESFYMQHEPKPKYKDKYCIISIFELLLLRAFTSSAAERQETIEDFLKWNKDSDYPFTGEDKGPDKAYLEAASFEDVLCWYYQIMFNYIFIEKEMSLSKITKMADMLYTIENLQTHQQKEDEGDIQMADWIFKEIQEAIQATKTITKENSRKELLRLTGAMISLRNNYKATLLNRNKGDK